MFYQKIIKPLLFKADPELVHDQFTKLGHFLGKFSLTRNLTKFFFDYNHPSLKQTIDGITYRNPVGLAAGFDKNAELTKIIPAIGFGFEEIGTITGEACAGNPKPRLWRIPEKKSLRVYYGLKNEGCEAIAKRLERTKNPLGISIGKTNSRETVDITNGIDDYCKAFRIMEPLADYLTVNISCPNAFGGEPFNEADKLDLLLTKIDEIKTNKPIYLKFSPDMETAQIDAILAVVRKHNVQGFIISNLTKKDGQQGGLSGLPVKNLSTTMIRYVYQKTQGKYTLIGCGGIFNGQDAYEKIKAGASLVQLITGMIYGGPTTIKRINKELVLLLQKEGYKNISEAIGKED